MSDRSRLGGTGPLAPLALLLAGCSGGADPPPDLLLVSLDTLRADRLSSYGHDRDTTPFLDGLAERGVRFARAYSPSAQTAPAHMSLFTGLYPFAHGVGNVNAGATNAPTLSEARTTLPELLSEAGFQTAAFSDGGNVMPEMGFARGFDERRFVLGEARPQLEAVRAWLADSDPDRPAFLFFHTYATHSPYLPGPAYRGRYTDPAYQGVFRRRLDELVGRPRLETFAQAARFLDPFEGMDERDVAWLSDLYDEAVASVDGLVERVVTAWEAHRDQARTLAIVLSDHGEEFGEHGSLGHKRGVYRELVHVPFIAAGPGLAPRVVEAPVDLTGLVATVCEWLGIDAPPDAAPSFAAACAGEPWTTAAHQQLALGKAAGRWSAVVSEGTRLVRHTVEGEDVVAHFGLDDRLEARPLDGDEAAGRLLALLVERTRADSAHQLDAPPGRAPIGSASDLRALEALGYLPEGR